jgi:hypothetical protein
MMLDRLHAQGGSHVAFAGSGTADEHDVIGTIHEVAAVQLPDQGLIYLAGGKVEAGQILVGGEPCGFDLVWAPQRKSTGRVASMIRTPDGIATTKRQPAPYAAQR